MDLCWFYGSIAHSCLASIYRVGDGLGVKLCILDINDLYLILWPAYYVSEISDGHHDIGVDIPDLVLAI